MLWYKAWLETRWRFLAGFALLSCSAIATIAAYPQIVKLLPLVSSPGTGALAERIREAAVLSSTYRGYVWLQWFRQDGARWTTFFAILLGTTAVFWRRGGELFTFSLPVSRTRLLSVRAWSGLAELVVIVFVPSLLLPLFSPSIGQSYAASSALIHALCAFVAASVFFCAALWLSTLFDDPWSPALLTIGAALGLVFVNRMAPGAPFAIFSVMSGERYFRQGQLPWLALLSSAALSAALFVAAIANVRRRDF